MGMGGEIMMMIHDDESHDEIHGDDVSDFRFAGGWSLLWHTSARFSFPALLFPLCVF